MLDNKTAVITGGAQGIGAVIARAFTEHGARIVIGDLDAAQAQRAATELGPDAIGIGCDVADGESVTALLDAARSASGSVDIMVNNAGITRDATMRKMAEAQFDDVIAVNLCGAWPPRSSAKVMVGRSSTCGRSRARWDSSGRPTVRRPRAALSD